MYYKSVNRGLSFTRAGMFSISFIMAIGLLAIVSGVNGLYLYLSLGLSILIISGVLSERVMRYSKITKFEEIIVDANQEFDLKFSIENTSSKYTLFGIDVYFLGKRPKIGILGGLKGSSLSGTVQKIPPSTIVECNANSKGLPRGAYQRFFVYQNTKYPFNLLEKFKYSDRKSSLVVIPAVDQKMFEELQMKVKSWLDDRAVDKQFYCHRNYSHQDSRKDVDWKRSANRPVNTWVTKEYRADSDQENIVVSFAWQDILDCTSEESFEKLLERVRTPFALLEKLEVKIGIKLDDGPVIWGVTDIYRELANIPKYEMITDSFNLTASSDLLEIEYTEIIVKPDQWHWNTKSTRRSNSQHSNSQESNSQQHANINKHSAAGGKV